MLERSPFAPGALYDWMWGCCGGTHAGSWPNNGNDLYAPPGVPLVAPITGTVVRSGIPPLGQGSRVGIQGDGVAVYMAHMTSLAVSTGDRVRAGDPVGVVWDFPAMPAHLHFSMARGSYDSGVFVDPKDALAATAEYVEGRTYRALGTVPPPPPAKPDGYWLEELPWHPVAAPDNIGPRVLGPWGSASLRDSKFQEMARNGNVVSKMGDGTRFYVYHWRPGSYGGVYRRGPWAAQASQTKARASLEGTLGRRLRPFKGRTNSLYPFL